MAVLAGTALLGGCSDRLPGPTEGTPVTNASIAFSWLENVQNTYPAPSHVAAVSVMGRDRREILGSGTVLAMADNGMTVISREDEFGVVTLLYGSIDDTLSFEPIDSEGNSEFDRGSVTISKDGEKVAYYGTDMINYLSYLNVIDMSDPLQPRHQSFPLYPPGGLFAMPAPVFSPHGDSIAFVDSDPNGVGYRLAVTPSDSYAPTTLADNVVPIGSAALDWSPSGGRIVYAGVDLLGLGVSGLYTIDPADPTKRDTIREITGGDLLLEPVWSNEGKEIAYVAYTSDERSSIRMVDVASKADRMVASSSTSIGAVQWSPDGSKLLYTDSREVLVSPDRGFDLLDGTLMIAELSTGRAYPVATRAVRGFWFAEQGVGY
jgi:hypothetical protein